MQQAEGKFKQKVVKQLRDYFGSDVLIHVTQERARNGVLDLHICLFGDHFEIELKVDGEKPTPLQYHNIEKCLQAGGFAFWSTPSQWETHFKMLQEKYLKRKPKSA